VKQKKIRLLSFERKRYTVSVPEHLLTRVLRLRSHTEWPMHNSNHNKVRKNSLIQTKLPKARYKERSATEYLSTQREEKNTHQPNAALCIIPILTKAPNPAMRTRTPHISHTNPLTYSTSILLIPAHPLVSPIPRTRTHLHLLPPHTHRRPRLIRTRRRTRRE
jgi:hypothetical protein